MSFKPNDGNTQDEAIRAMEDCIKDMRNGLNDDKTVFLAIGTRQQLDKLNPSVPHVGDHTIGPSVNVRNLGTPYSQYS